MKMPAPDTLCIHQLCYAYPDSSWTLRVNQFRLHAGEIAAIIGPNGSGKSTLLRLAAGVLPFSQGTIEINRKNIHGLDRRSIARQIGYLPQDTLYEFDHRVLDVVSMGRYSHLTLGGFLGEHDLSVVEHCLDQTQTGDLRHRRLSRLSGGERQRVLLASVLAQEPSLLLLDEPTSALDLHHQINFFQILLRLVTNGMAVAVVMHDLNLASLYCQRLVLMEQGRMIRDGEPEEVLQLDILKEVYGEEIILARHPQTGSPLVFPRIIGDAS